MDGEVTQIPRSRADGAATRLADIAVQAGVSEATVSRVLNGKPGVS
ncbi:LacI family DNA-binding transcriptional regulator, partial [Planomonospora parontospora]